MPNVTSSLGTTGDGIPAVNSGQIGKFRGLFMHYPNLTALNSVSATVKSLWAEGQPLTIAGEAAGVHRLWDATELHARTVVLPSGITLVLLNNSSTVLATTGAPGGGVGAVGDLAVDLPAGVYYTKTGASTWSAPSQVGAGTSGVSADPGNALSLGADSKPFYDGAPSGTLPWANGRSYPVGSLALVPSGRLVRSIESHTATVPFDARKWVFPTDDGSTLFDFTQMPDTALVDIHPTKGRLFSFGVRPAFFGEWVVKDGLFQENPLAPSTGVIYFEGALTDDSLLLQHMWCVADVNQNLEDVSGITFVWNTLPLAPDGGTPVAAGIHWGMLPRIGASYAGLWGTEPYPLGFGGVSNGPPHIPAQQPRGRTMRWDITVDIRTGQMTGYIDGLVVMQYTDINILGAIRNRAIFEIEGPNFKVREFGLSPHMPLWAINGDARGLRLTGNDNTPITTLTGTYQRLHQFPVGYDAGAAVSVSWSPFVSCSAGQVFMELGPADPTEFAAYVATTVPQVVAEAGTNCRVAFAGWQVGVPGTGKSLGIWARTTGTATVRQDTYGNYVGGPRWQPAVYRSSVNT